MLYCVRLAQLKADLSCNGTVRDFHRGVSHVCIGRHSQMRRVRHHYKHAWDEYTPACLPEVYKVVNIESAFLTQPSSYGNRKSWHFIRKVERDGRSRAHLLWEILLNKYRQSHLLITFVGHTTRYVVWDTAVSSWLVLALHSYEIKLHI